MKSLRDRVRAAFEQAESIGEFVSEQARSSDDVAPKHSVEQVQIELAALSVALRNALTEIATDIDKLTASQLND